MRSRRAAGASPEPTAASWSSSAAGCRAIASGRESASRSDPGRRPRSSSCSNRPPTGSPTPACTAASPARAPHGRAFPTSFSSPTRRPRCARRSSESASSRGSRSSRSSRAPSGGATGTSSSTRSGRCTPRTLPRSASMPAGSWDRVVDVDDCQLASDANNAARNEIRAWAANEGLPAYDKRSTRRGAAEPDRPRGPSHRAAADPPRHRRGGASRVHPSTCTRWSAATRGGTAGATGVLGEEYLHGAARRARAARLPLRLPADQHRDGRAALRGRARVRRPRRRRAAVRPLLRDRHDRVDAWPPTPARSGGSRTSPTRSSTPRRTRSSTGSATRASAPATPDSASGR